MLTYYQQLNYSRHLNVIHVFASVVWCETAVYFFYMFCLFCTVIITELLTLFFLSNLCCASLLKVSKQLNKKQDVFVKRKSPDNVQFEGFPRS